MTYLVYFKPDLAIKNDKTLAVQGFGSLFTFPLLGTVQQLKGLPLQGGGHRQHRGRRAVPAIAEHAPHVAALRCQFRQQGSEALHRQR